MTQTDKVATETEFIIVECVHQHRIRYVVEVPQGKTEWATDTVVMQCATEFSQADLGETIISTRSVTREEILKLCDEDNDYARKWNDDHKFSTFVTFQKDYDV